MTIEGILLSNKNGRLLFYRNYGDIAHSLFEDFAFSLPQKIKIESQHTFSIHGQNRLIYLPVDNLLVVVVTTLDSNIIEDISTVQMLKDLVYQILGQSLSEEGVFENYVDLAFGFDGMVNLKMRNFVNKTDIMSFLEMDSNNERMHNAMMKERENEQKKKTEAEFRKIEKTQKMQNLLEREFQEIDNSIKNYSLEHGIKSDTDKSNLQFQNVKKDTPKETKKSNIKGMKLGKTKKKTELSKMFKLPQKNKKKQSEEVVEDEVIPIEETKPTFNPLSENVIINIEEIMRGEINAQGEYSSFDYKGKVYFYINNPNLGKFVVSTEQKDFKFLNPKLPPNMDKSSWKKGQLTLKKNVQNFQPQVNIETLKYGLNIKELDQVVPFNISFWFSGQEFSTELEFNSEQTIFKSIQNIEIHFRLLTDQSLYQETQLENSNTNVTDHLIWIIDEMNEEKESASLILNFNKSVSQNDVLPAEIIINQDKMRMIKMFLI